MDLKDVERMATDLMSEHGLLGIGWTFKFDRAKTRLGQCNYQKKTISLSRPIALAVDQKVLRNTILHEIAHAHTPGHGHNRIWKRMFIQIGGNGETRSSVDHSKITYKYTGTCNGGHKFYRHRRPNPSLVCVTCYNATGDKYPIDWVEA